MDVLNSELVGHQRNDDYVLLLVLNKTEEGDDLIGHAWLLARHPQWSQQRLASSVCMMSWQPCEWHTGSQAYRRSRPLYVLVSDDVPRAGVC